MSRLRKASLESSKSVDHVGGTKERYIYVQRNRNLFFELKGFKQL